MIAFVPVQDGWSIANLDEDTATFAWWCGYADEWVEPNANSWVEDPNCRNIVFPTLAHARRAAKRIER